MASDEDYMSFLNKANENPSAGVTTSSKKEKVQLKTKDAGAEIPSVLKIPTENEEWIYSSDADEPFVGVNLKISGGKLPDEKTFAKLINHPSGPEADITILDITEWDREGQYKDVVDATREACKGADVRVYRVPIGGPRIEYWVVGLEKVEGRLVGVKALGIES